MEHSDVIRFLLIYFICSSAVVIISIIFLSKPHKLFEIFKQCMSVSELFLVTVVAETDLAHFLCSNGIFSCGFYGEFL